ncbi:hypothetical protein OL239_18040 [Arthrobacter sp. ATA002]|uniref:hypothetical protein n=1 Tax=Arthrobacter sp. ATA002 TaxID=2991715 RepID=UPI0022A7486C|nr:hypothetical protein [Arthrobacter sp. ATA002]WAP51638.1 hypothetical protein OL239_18040 [Arthrobacter sp. ATA002]
MNSSLFSHAEQPEPAQEPETVQDVVVERSVPRELHEAFNGFTEYVHLWWPEQYTEYGEGTHPEFETGSLTETAPDGRTAVWASVSGRVQDSELVLDWVAGHSPRTPTEVRVAFTPVSGSETNISLRHSGLGHLAEAVEARLGYAAAWPVILDRYARFMGAR